MWTGQTHISEWMPSLASQLSIACSNQCLRSWPLSCPCIHLGQQGKSQGMVFHSPCHLKTFTTDARIQAVSFCMCNDGNSPCMPLPIVWKSKIALLGLDSFKICARSWRTHTAPVLKERAPGTEEAGKWHQRTGRLGSPKGASRKVTSG